jgi:hypothetical protein
VASHQRRYPEEGRAVSTWTVEKWDTSSGSGLVDYRVLGNGTFRAFISVPDTDEGRATVALMVGAIQMREALRTLRQELSYYEKTDTGERISSVTAALEDADVALEASKKLPKEK